MAINKNWRDWLGAVILHECDADAKTERAQAAERNGNYAEAADLRAQAARHRGWAGFDRRIAGQFASEEASEHSQ